MQFQTLLYRPKHKNGVDIIFERACINEKANPSNNHMCLCGDEYDWRPDSTGKLDWSRQRGSSNKVGKYIDNRFGKYMQLLHCKMLQTIDHCYYIITCKAPLAIKAEKDAARIVKF